MTLATEIHKLVSKMVTKGTEAFSVNLDVKQALSSLKIYGARAGVIRK